MKKNYLILLFTIFSLFSSKNVSAQSEPYVGQIMIFAGNFAPRGWAICDGSLLSVNQYNALYAILGTMYGGDGRSTFGLPDLRGRVPVGVGTGQGLTTVVNGQMAGTETVTLTTANLPAHSHTLNGSTAAGNSNVPTSNFHADTSVLDKDYTSTANLVQMNPLSIGTTGSSSPVQIRQPYTGLIYCIAIEGVYPTRP